jgi:hypothetical protein
MTSKRITRQAKLSGLREVVVERSGLGQVAEYDVYIVHSSSAREYQGGGSKREAQRIFDGIVRDDTKVKA